ncbi:hypothetical protein LTR74_015456 [Friedmanniomyces endolithicus]|nr:hypothetical protein LTR74_015456 [Friedmanniomyces endolithicus]
MSFPQSDSAPPARTDAAPTPSNANPAYTTRDGNSMPATFANAADPLDDCVAAVCCAAVELPVLIVPALALALPPTTAALPLPVPDADADVDAEADASAEAADDDPVLVAVLEIGERIVTPAKDPPDVVRAVSTVVEPDVGAPAPWVDTAAVPVVALEVGVRIVTPVKDPSEVVRVLSGGVDVDVLAPCGMGWMIPGMELEVEAMSETVDAEGDVEGVPVWMAVAAEAARAKRATWGAGRMVVAM